jgi:hypothetical protein
MTYRDLDPALSAWCSTHGLHVITRDRDCEVRTITVVDDAGSTYQLWLELLPGDGVRVAAWDYGAQRASRDCELPDLGQALEAVYAQVESWIATAGHTRTPAL